MANSLIGRGVFGDATIIGMIRTFGVFAAILVSTSLCVQLGADDVYAAKTNPSPDLSDARNPDVPATQDELDRAKLVNIDKPDPIVRDLAEPADFYYKYRSSISLRSGAEWALNDLQNPGLTLGVLYAYPLGDLRGVEAGADLNPNGTGTLHFARREMIGNERFRWFYKYGLGVRVVGSDQLVTFLRLKNWQVRGGGGFEWTTSDTVSFRFDAEPIFSTENIRVTASIGVAFAF